MPEKDYSALADELAAFGRLLPSPVPDAGLAVAVLARISDQPQPKTPTSWQLQFQQIVTGVRRQRRRTAAVVFALLLSLLAAPPVRAAIADWFSFAGVIVRHDPNPGPRSAPPAPTIASPTTLEAAKDLVNFKPVVPTVLGPPEGIEVSQDRRLLSMSWNSVRDGPVRLDEFDGKLDNTFAKTAHGAEFTSVAGSFALWFSEPHGVVVLNPDGTSRTETARLAGHTLIWTNGGTTLRLEADISRARAIEIAASAAEVP
jgi:hypothetical protein